MRKGDDGCLDSQKTEDENGKRILINRICGRD